MGPKAQPNAVYPVAVEYDDIPVTTWFMMDPEGTNSATTPVGAAMKVACNPFVLPARMSAILHGTVVPIEILTCDGGATAGNGKSHVISTIAPLTIVN